MKKLLIGMLFLSSASSFAHFDQVETNEAIISLTNCHIDDLSYSSTTYPKKNEQTDGIIYTVNSPRHIEINSSQRFGKPIKQLDFPVIYSTRKDLQRNVISLIVSVVNSQDPDAFGYDPLGNSKCNAKVRLKNGAILESSPSANPEINPDQVLYKFEFEL
jgi:hypothetical protein